LTEERVCPSSSQQATIFALFSNRQLIGRWQLKA
jgi:hypothetical protein